MLQVKKGFAIFDYSLIKIIFFNYSWLYLHFDGQKFWLWFWHPHRKLLNGFGAVPIAMNETWNETRVKFEQTLIK
jgi:hypothetical protein